LELLLMTYLGVESKLHHTVFIFRVYYIPHLEASTQYNFIMLLKLVSP
jgi:hypothetical protein